MNPGYLFLALHIVAAVSFGHVMKWAMRRGCELVAVGGVNYVFASATCLTVALIAASPPLTLDGWGAGLLGGLSYVVSYFFFYQAIRLTGVGVSSAVNRLSVLPAVVASIFIWGERPAAHQVVGIILVLVALPLLSQQPGDKTARLAGPVWGWLLALFLTTSGGAIAAKLSQEVGNPLAKPLLLGVWFAAAAIVAIAALVIQHRRPTRDDIRLGVILGFVNVVGNFSLLTALDTLPGAVVFPAASAGGVLVVVVSSWLLWGERLGRPALAGSLVAIPALVLMNLP